MQTPSFVWQTRECNYYCAVAAAAGNLLRLFASFIQVLSAVGFDFIVHLGRVLSLESKHIYIQTHCLRRETILQCGGVSASLSRPRRNRECQLNQLSDQHTGVENEIQS